MTKRFLFFVSVLLVQLQALLKGRRVFSVDLPNGA